MTSRNIFWLFEAAFIFGLSVAGHVLFGRQGGLIFFLFSVGLIALGNLFGKKLLIIVYNAELLEGRDPYQLCKISAKWASQIGLDQIQVYLVPSYSPNAMALSSGARSGNIFITYGMINLLNAAELESVVIQLLCQIRLGNYFSGWAAVMASIFLKISDYFGWLSRFGRSVQSDNKGHSSMLVEDISRLVTAPLASLLLLVSGQKKRLIQADQEAASLIHDSQVLANALWKIEHHQRAIPLTLATQGTSHMFLVYPLGLNFLDGLFNTFPPIEDRIKKLIGRSL